MGDGFYRDGRLDYPGAEDLVDSYIAEKAKTRDRVTSVDVLRWAEVRNVEHNRRRVYWALADRLPEAGDFGGRTVFSLGGQR